MLNITEILEELKSSPFEEVRVTAPHTGRINFKNIKTGEMVRGPQGEWKEKLGTLLAVLDRESNPKPIHAPKKGVLSAVHHELENCFVEAGTCLLSMRHPLTRDEVLHTLLRRALHLFNAPELAKYYFSPETDQKIRAGGAHSITVHDGAEIFIMSRMKREAPLAYHGPEGIIYAVYFKHTENVNAGDPLIGVCPPDQLETIEEVVMRVRTEWKERADG